MIASSSPLTPSHLLVLWTLLFLVMSLVPHGCPLLSSLASLERDPLITKLPTACQANADNETPCVSPHGTDVELFRPDCLV